MNFRELFTKLDGIVNEYQDPVTGAGIRGLQPRTNTNTATPQPTPQPSRDTADATTPPDQKPAIPGQQPSLGPKPQMTPQEVQAIQYPNQKPAPAPAVVTDPKADVNAMTRALQAIANQQKPVMQPTTSSSVQQQQADTQDTQQIAKPGEPMEEGGPTGDKDRWAISRYLNPGATIDNWIKDVKNDPSVFYKIPEKERQQVWKKIQRTDVGDSVANLAKKTDSGQAVTPSSQEDPTTKNEKPPAADPNAPKPADPNAPKPADPNAPKPADPNAPKPADPNAPKPADPNAPKPADPNAPKPADPNADKKDGGKDTPEKPVKTKVDLNYKGTKGSQEIQKLNPDVIKNVNVIKPGQELKMPDGSIYTVKAGDALDRIARQHGVTGDGAHPEKVNVGAQIEKDKANIQNTPVAQAQSPEDREKEIRAVNAKIEKEKQDATDKAYFDKLRSEYTNKDSFMRKQGDHAINDKGEAVYWDQGNGMGHGQGSWKSMPGYHPQSSTGWYSPELVAAGKRQGFIPGDDTFTQPDNRSWIEKPFKDRPGTMTPNFNPKAPDSADKPVPAAQEKPSAVDPADAKALIAKTLANPTGGSVDDKTRQAASGNTSTPAGAIHNAEQGDKLKEMSAQLHSLAESLINETK